MGVTGIGGFFFRAHDPAVLAGWYAAHLGVGTGEYGQWRQDAGPSVFAPFPADTDYLPAERTWMLNLRVDGLAAMLEALSAAGIAYETRAEWDAPETGRFARLHDPEGNPIELWQPPDLEAPGGGA